MTAKLKGQLDGEPSLARRITEQFGRACDALEDRVAVGVKAGSSARCVVCLLKIDTQRFSQAGRGRVVLGERAEGRRDELARRARIVCRERRDLKFPIGAESTACWVAEQQSMNSQCGLVSGAKPFDAPARRADGDSHIVG